MISFLLVCIRSVLQENELSTASSRLSMCLDNKLTRLSKRVQMQKPILPFLCAFAVLFSRVRYGEVMSVPVYMCICLLFDNFNLETLKLQLEYLLNLNFIYG